MTTRKVPESLVPDERQDCDHPVIGPMAPDFPGEWACYRCGQRFMPQNRAALAAAHVPVEEPRCPICPHPAHRGWCEARPHGDPCSCRQSTTFATLATPSAQDERPRTALGEVWDPKKHAGGQDETPENDHLRGDHELWPGEGD